MKVRVIDKPEEAWILYDIWFNIFHNFADEQKAKESFYVVFYNENNIFYLINKKQLVENFLVVVNLKNCPLLYNSLNYRFFDFLILFYHFIDCFFN